MVYDAKPKLPEPEWAAENPELQMRNAFIRDAITRHVAWLHENIILDPTQAPQWERDERSDYCEAFFTRLVEGLTH